jgi:hypothetical protein
MSSGSFVGGVTQTFQQNPITQPPTKITSRTALMIFSATSILTGIFMPINWLILPMTIAAIKNRMNPTIRPRNTAAASRKRLGVEVFSFIKIHGKSADINPCNNQETGTNIPKLRCPGGEGSCLYYGMVKILNKVAP